MNSGVLRHIRFCFSAFNIVRQVFIAVKHYRELLLDIVLSKEIKLLLLLLLLLLLSLLLLCTL